MEDLRNPDGKALEKASGIHGLIGLAGSCCGIELVSDGIEVHDNGNGFGNVESETLATFVAGVDTVVGVEENCVDIGGIEMGDLVDDVHDRKYEDQADILDSQVDKSFGDSSRDGSKGVGIDNPIIGDGLKEDNVSESIPVSSDGKIEALGDSISLFVDLDNLDEKYSSELAMKNISIGRSQLPMHQLRGPTDANDIVTESNSLDQIVVPQNLQRLSEVSYNENLQAHETSSLAKLTQGDMDMLLEHQRSVAAEEEILSDNLASKLKRKVEDSEFSNGGDKVDFINGHKEASLFKEETNLLMSPTLIDSKVSGAENDDRVNSENTEKGSESRERKKSKYLSYPYVSWGEKGLPAETEDSRTPKVSHVVSPSLLTCGSKKFRKNRRSNAGSDILKVINTSAAELLAVLNLTALDCLYPNDNENFDLIMLFFSQFRTSVYHEEMHSRPILGQKEVIAVEPSLSEKDPWKEILSTSGSLVNNPMGKTHTSPKGKPAHKKSKGSNGKKSPKSRTKPTSGLLDVNVSIAASTLFVKDSQEMGPLLPNGKPERKKRKKKEGAASLCLQTKQINGGPNLLTENSHILGDVAFEGKPEPKKRKRKEGATLKCSKTKLAAEISDFNGTRCSVETNGEAQGTKLILKFAPGTKLPAEEVLVSTFCRFGPLKESETLLLKDSTNALVVFTRSDDAREAFRSLEKSNPFGEALVNYQLHHLSAASKAGGLKTPTVKLSWSSGETPSLDFVKQNLEMMTSMLDKAGDDLLPEMRARLEGEIKSLLHKVKRSCEL